MAKDLVEAEAKTLAEIMSEPKEEAADSNNEEGKEE